MKYYLLESNLLEEQKRKNRQMEESYAYIIEFVKRVSDSLDDKRLRTRIEINHKHHPDTVASIHECITPYCVVSLGADETGYYNIVYSINYQATELIGEYTLSALVRGINRYMMDGYTNEGIEHRVRINSLAMDIVPIFNQLLEIGENDWTRIMN
ncbi:hypothetical protein [Desertivirga xinjiangensis]|uniref:hypothetical protein n=1 Tax=Desertivirga xinjiangensis TaxID=539206 RepID=UPI00210AA2A4|nr:hypothetical protein [Pedobacter xinjiangensis]